MFQRVVTTIVAAAILIAVTIFDNKILFGIAAVVVATIALNEFYGAVKLKGIKPIEWLGYASTLFLMLIGNVDSKTIVIIFGLLFPLLLLIAFLKSIKDNIKTNIIDISVTLLGVLYIVYLISFLVFTRQMQNGAYYMWFIFGGAWFTDIFAFLIGSKFGKHKFKKISKSKSIEGSISGIIGAVLFFVIYSIYLNSLGIESITLNVGLMGIIGLIASIVSQIGDFAASTIKRYCDIKDYGTILPGHGGILDRFDSILFVAPIIYLFFSII